MQSIAIILFVIAFAVVAVLFGIRDKWMLSKGKVGERAVSYWLGKLPVEDYKVINDVMLKFGGWTSQIDHVVISRYGIFVIETKNFEGRISGGRDSAYWTQNIYGYKYELRNPIHQNASHVSAIRKLLGDVNLRIIPVVTFSGRAELYVKSDGANVIYYNELLPFIKSYKSRCFSDEQVSRMYHLLMAANVIDKEERSHMSLRHRTENLRQRLC